MPVFSLLRAGQSSGLKEFHLFGLFIRLGRIVCLVISRWYLNLRFRRGFVELGGSLCNFLAGHIQ